MWFSMNCHNREHYPTSVSPTLKMVISKVTRESEGIDTSTPEESAQLVTCLYTAE